MKKGVVLLFVVFLLVGGISWADEGARVETLGVAISSESPDNCEVKN